MKYPNKHQIIKMYPIIERYYGEHPDEKDDYSIKEHLDEDGDSIRIDKDMIIPSAPFAGQGSDKYPICPFCGYNGICTEHSVIDKLMNRTDLYRFILSNTGIDIEYRNNHMLRFGIVWSGNICFSADSLKSFKAIMNELLSKGSNRGFDEEVHKHFDKLMNLNEGGNYTSINTQSSWEYGALK